MRRNGRSCSGPISCAPVIRATMRREEVIAKIAYRPEPMRATTPSLRSSTAPMRPATTPSSRTKPKTTMPLLQAVPTDLLLQRHVEGVNATCGTATSPSAAKNSFSRNPSGRATSTHGRLWMPVL